MVVKKNMSRHIGNSKHKKAMVNIIADNNKSSNDYIYLNSLIERIEQKGNSKKHIELIEKVKELQNKILITEDLNLIPDTEFIELENIYDGL